VEDFGAHSLPVEHLAHLNGVRGISGIRKVCASLECPAILLPKLKVLFAARRLTDHLVGKLEGVALAEPGRIDAGRVIFRHVLLFHRFAADRVDCPDRRVAAAARTMAGVLELEVFPHERLRLAVRLQVRRRVQRLELWVREHVEGVPVPAVRFAHREPVRRPDAHLQFFLARDHIDESLGAGGLSLQEGSSSFTTCR